MLDNRKGRVEHMAMALSPGQPEMRQYQESNEQGVSSEGEPEWEDYLGNHKDTN